MRNRTKVALVATIAAALVLILSACSGSAGQSSDTGATPTKPAAVASVTTDSLDGQDPIRSGCADGAKHVVKPEDVQDGQGNVIAQVTMVASDMCQTAWPQITNVTQAGQFILTIYSQNGQRNATYTTTGKVGDRIYGNMLTFDKKRCVYGSARLSTTRLTFDTATYCG